MFPLTVKVCVPIPGASVKLWGGIVALVVLALIFLVLAVDAAQHRFHGIRERCREPCGDPLGLRPADRVMLHCE